MSRVLIIAEAGVNHNGDLDTAIRMVDAAKRAGVDIVKFQTAIPELVISKFAEKADYQKITTKASESQLEMVRRLHLKFEEYVPLKKHCDDVGIKFLSTPFDIDSVRFLEQLGCDMWKIPSGEITNYPYLMEIAKTKKPVIMSTGMCTLEDIRVAIDVLRKRGVEDITLLHCTTEYPTPLESVNLKAMDVLRKEFRLPVGYSDHTQGIKIPIAAVAMGAVIIEKHFTLDRLMEGPDQKASLEPCELKEMVDSIRSIEIALGDGRKQPSEVEKKNIVAARKSIVAKMPIKEGEVFSEDNLTTKRPGNGISPMMWEDVIGKIALRDFEEDELIEI